MQKTEYKSIVYINPIDIFIFNTRYLELKVTKALNKGKPQNSDRKIEILQVLWGDSKFPMFDEGEDFSMENNIIIENGAGKLNQIASILERNNIKITIIKTDEPVSKTVGIISDEILTQEEFDNKLSIVLMSSINKSKGINHIINQLNNLNISRDEYKVFLRSKILDNEAKLNLIQSNLHNITKNLDNILNTINTNRNILSNL
jgi:hypothetical protein